MNGARDHGGGTDAVVARFGNAQNDWIDLSTGINPVPYPIPTLEFGAWTALPDHGAQKVLEVAAREFCSVPDGASILAAPGASSLIAKSPELGATGAVHIPAHGWTKGKDAPEAWRRLKAAL